MKMFTDGRTDGQTDGRTPTDRRTDARLIAISPEPFCRRIKITIKDIYNFIFFQEVGEGI